MTNDVRSRRAFLKATAALAGVSPLTTFLVRTPGGQTTKPLLAYVGTFSSPLRDTLPTQVDLPPGNGRGIHIFHVDRTTGAMTASGVQSRSARARIASRRTPRERGFTRRMRPTAWAL